MDEVDKRILNELIDDSRLSYNEISRRVGISVATVTTRVRNLEKQGIIRGYSVTLDTEKIGYDVTAIIEITISKGKLLEVEKEIAKNPNVHGVYDVTGTSDAMVLAKFKGRKELSDFVKSLLSLEYVERTLTHFVLGTMKEDLRVNI